MNIKGISAGLAIAFVIIPIVAHANPTTVKNAVSSKVAVDTRWSQKSKGRTKDGYPIMRMFSQRAFVAVPASLPTATK